MSDKPDNLRPASVEELIRLWTLRMLVPLGGHSRFGEYEWTQYRHLASLHDLPSLDPGEEKSFKEHLVKVLRQRHSEAEASSAERGVPVTLQRNIRQLQELVGLTEVDGRILEFATLLHTSIELEQAANVLGDLGTQMPALIGYGSGGSPRLPSECVAACGCQLWSRARRALHRAAAAGSEHFRHTAPSRGISRERRR